MLLQQNLSSGFLGISSKCFPSHSQQICPFWGSLALRKEDQSCFCSGMPPQTSATTRSTEKEGRKRQVQDIFSLPPKRIIQKVPQLEILLWLFCSHGYPISMDFYLLNLSPYVFQAQHPMAKCLAINFNFMLGRKLLPLKSDVLI